MENQEKWIRRRLRQLVKVEYDIQSLEEIKQPHRLHKKSWFSCKLHNCTICRENSRKHKKEHRENKDVFSALHGLGVDII